MRVTNPLSSCPRALFLERECSEKSPDILPPGEISGLFFSALDLLENIVGVVEILYGLVKPGAKKKEKKFAWCLGRRSLRVWDVAATVEWPLKQRGQSQLQRSRRLQVMPELVEVLRALRKAQKQVPSSPVCNSVPPAQDEYTSMPPDGLSRSQSRVRTRLRVAQLCPATPSGGSSRRRRLQLPQKVAQEPRQSQFRDCVLRG